MVGLDLPLASPHGGQARGCGGGGRVTPVLLGNLPEVGVSGIDHFSKYKVLYLAL